jgi:hypothetical protein
MTTWEAGQAVCPACWPLGGKMLRTFGNWFFTNVRGAQTQQETEIQQNSEKRYNHCIHIPAKTE